MGKKELLDALQTLSKLAKQEIEDSYVSSSLRFRMIAGTNTDSGSEFTFYCPNCGSSFTIMSQPGGTLSCPHCGYKPKTLCRGRYVGGSSLYVKTSNYDYAEAVCYAKNLPHGILGVLNCDARISYDFDKKSCSVEIIPSNVVLISDSSVESYDVHKERKSGRYNIERFDNIIRYGRYYNGDDRFATDDSIAEISSWLHATGEPSFKDLQAKFDSAKSATAKAVVKTIPDMDDKLRSIDDYSDEIIRIVTRNSYIVVGYKKDVMTDEEEEFFWCGSCGHVNFYHSDKASYSSYHYDRICNCCEKALSPLRTRYYSASGNDNIVEAEFAVIEPYSGDMINGEGIMIRLLRSKVKWFLDGENMPIFQAKNEEHTRVLYDAEKKTFQEYGFEKTCPSAGWHPQKQSRSGFDYAFCADDKGTWMSRTGLKEFTKFYMSTYRYNSDRLLQIKRYIDCSNRFPAFEILTKSGFESLIYDIICKPMNDAAWDYVKEHFNGSVKDAIGVSAKFGRACRIGTYPDIRKIAKYIEAYNSIQPDEINWFADNGVVPDRLLKIKALLPDTQAKDIQAYLENVRCFQAFPPNRAHLDWLDYLETAKEMGMDVSDKKVRYPRSLKKEHDIALAKQTLIKDTSIQGAFKEQTERAQLKYGWHNKNFVVRTPESMEELFEEGRKLSHSVGSYSDAIASGDMCILFIRKTKSPDTPYFTVEINESDDSILQMRSFSNRLIDIVDESDLASFVYEWCEKKRLSYNGILPKKKAV